MVLAANSRFTAAQDDATLMAERMGRAFYVTEFKYCGIFSVTDCNSFRPKPGLDIVYAVWPAHPTRCKKADVVL